MSDDVQHTRWSAPGAQRERLSELPSSPTTLADALANFLMAYGSAKARGVDVSPEAEEDRNLRSVARLLETAFFRDSRSLTVRRRAAGCLYGTCHDFALLAVSALRESGIPARLRVGFASYLRPGRWEDHWVCEHKASGQWAIFDAELNSRARTARGITFDGTNIPKSRWQSAAAIWQKIEAGEIDPAICGISFANLSGKWFVARSMLQDAAALAGIETLPWDNWGPALRFGATRQLTEEQTKDFDALAVTLNPPPITRAEAENVLTRFPWAKPTPVVVSFPSHHDRREIVLADT
ncbi:transglutaminase domain-containing protein [Bradyrhizobium frederickii]|uniref:Transglutaminase domain-containing protein n=1 Tax=Bradyrhizobium frederickii TaxID=2560054 RepID=A0A4Y9LKP9_9BRAD|nr:transglutaminase-like domain-containing protein [Bradyrhizobium frederickii]TFV42533.1 transglutaminase domain-containing protein [Bradyrhizobium frederickii]